MVAPLDLILRTPLLCVYAPAPWRSFIVPVFIILVVPEVAL